MQDDLFSARGARDAALNQVMTNVGSRWLNRAVAIIAGLPRGYTGTGEDIRLLVEATIERPHHHNVYGALITKAVKSGLLVPTGKLVQMKTVKSHARKTMIYRRT